MCDLYSKDNDCDLTCDHEEDYKHNIGRPRQYYGGNSGYVNYSKSKRAVQAEANGLRNKSQMDASFADEVNEIIQYQVPGAKRVTLKQIKRSLDKIKPDEWHHTSMYGNRTNYYSAETIAEYLRPETDQERQNREELEELRIERRNLHKYIEDYIFDAIPKIKIKDPNSINHYCYFYMTSEGHLIEVFKSNLLEPPANNILFIRIIPAGNPAEYKYSFIVDDNTEKFINQMSHIGDYEDAYKNLMIAQKEVYDLVDRIKSTDLKDAITEMEALTNQIRNFYYSKIE